ncbi:hypothetical protein EYF80_054610 [Liparis tanakae]|uniref:Uncharacterized protein n=1 Tax=Liparis tanakae TaxID=230148 RepID=A0A4Z2F3H1_9TELE|nr:hypothetical protein EYF80_054610 [Liparis tanakae]
MRPSITNRSVGRFSGRFLVSRVLCPSPPSGPLYIEYLHDEQLSPESRVQSPEPRVQSPEPRVQGPDLHLMYFLLTDQCVDGPVIHVISRLRDARDFFKESRGRGASVSSSSPQWTIDPPPGLRPTGPSLVQVHGPSTHPQVSGLQDPRWSRSMQAECRMKA